MTRDYFRIEGPAIISFSGGRSSAYMLWRIVQAHGGHLPDDVLVCFANTGKEMPQTLDFVRDCGSHWGIDVVWLEMNRGQVDFDTASRQGEPYTALIDKRGFLPNPVARFCTSDLKIKPMRDYALGLGWDSWTVALGLRADEPARVIRARTNQNESWEAIAPLASAGINKDDVKTFWLNCEFDLRLPKGYGNCDLCFLKGASQISAIMRDNPHLARWWIEQEETGRASKHGGGRFRSDRPSYAQLLDAAQRQGNLDFGDLDARIDCFCGDDTA